jgi:hypothetical protein
MHMLLLLLQDVIEIMREGMLDRAPLGGMPGGLPMLDFRKAPGSRGGKAGEAARFMAALRAMGSQQGRDVFDSAELQVRPLCSWMLLDLNQFCCLFCWNASRPHVALQCNLLPACCLCWGEVVVEHSAWQQPADADKAAQFMAALWTIRAGICSTQQSSRCRRVLAASGSNCCCASGLASSRVACRQS